jgi:Cu+-exporting ATPase
MHKPVDMHASHGGGGTIDPVCGMTVDPEDARDRGLHHRHEDADYYFCGKGCKQDFRDDPGRYLKLGYRPQM